MAQEKSEQIKSQKIAKKVMQSDEWGQTLNSFFGYTGADEMLAIKSAVGQVDSAEYLVNLCQIIDEIHGLDFSTVSKEIIMKPALRGLMSRVQDGRAQNPEELVTLASVIATMNSIFLRTRDVLQGTHKFDFSNFEKDSVLAYFTTIALMQTNAAKPKKYGEDQEYLSQDIYFMEQAQDLANNIAIISQVSNLLRARLEAEHDVELKKFESLLSSNGDEHLQVLLNELKAIAAEANKKKLPSEEIEKSVPVLVKKYYNLYRQKYPAQIPSSSPIIQATPLKVEPLKREPEKDVELAPELAIRTPDIDDTFLEKYQIREDTYYIYDPNKADEEKHISHFINEASKENASLLCIEQQIAKEAVNKQDLIRNLIRQAIQQALEHKNGRLFMEPIGLEFDEITAQWYADMVAEEILSLDAELRDQVDISFAIMPGAKNKEFDRKIKEHLLNYRFARWPLEALGFDSTIEINQQASKQAVDTLLQSLNLFILSDMREAFLEFFRMVISLDADNFAKKQYIEQKEILFERVRAYFKPEMFEKFDTTVFLKDGFENELLTAPIKNKLAFIQKLHTINGEILDAVKHKRAVPIKPMFQTEEVATALCQLALKNEAHAEELMDVMIYTKGNIEQALLRVHEEDRYPRHIIFNSAGNETNRGVGHWTRLKIEKVEQKVVFTYVDSYPGKPSTAFLGGESKLKQIFGPNIEVNANGTGHQPRDEAWSCGLHATLGVVREIGVEDIPNTDLSKDYGKTLAVVGGKRIEERPHTVALRNWFFQLLTGLDYDVYYETHKANSNPVRLSSGSQTAEPDPKEVTASAFKLPHLIGQANNTIQMLNTLFSVGLSSEQAKALAPKVGELEEEVKAIRELENMFKSLPSHVKAMINLKMILEAIEVDLPKLFDSYQAIKKNECFVQLAEIYEASKPQEEEVIADVDSKQQPLPPISLLIESSKIFQEWNREEVMGNLEHGPYREYVNKAMGLDS